MGHLTETASSVGNTARSWVATTTNGATTTNSTTVSTFLITNLHCPSCVSTIDVALGAVQPAPTSVSSSILDHSVQVHHASSLSAAWLRSVLEDAGFEVYSFVSEHLARHDGMANAENPNFERPSTRKDEHFEEAVASWPKTWTSKVTTKTQWEKHVSQCGLCREEAIVGFDDARSISLSVSERKDKEWLNDDHLYGRRAQPGSEKVGTDAPFVVVESVSPSTSGWHATMIIEGMNCGSCVAQISDVLASTTGVRSAEVVLMTSSASVKFESREHLDAIVQAVVNIGYEARVADVSHIDARHDPGFDNEKSTWRATFSIGGMTCSSCVKNITEALRAHSSVVAVDLDLFQTAQPSSSRESHVGPTFRPLLRPLAMRRS